MPYRLTIAAPLLTFLALTPLFSQASLEEARESLLQRSPFVKWAPPRETPPPKPEPVVQTGALSRELQFNGIMQIGDETYFNIFDKIENRSMLMGIGENKGRFSVVDYNASGDRSITVQAGSGGRQEKISLATSDGVSIPTTTPTASQNQARPTPNRPAVTNRSRSTPVSERRRRVIPRRINTSRSSE